MSLRKSKLTEAKVKEKVSSASVVGGTKKFILVISDPKNSTSPQRVITLKIRWPTPRKTRKPTEFSCGDPPRSSCLSLSFYHRKDTSFLIFGEGGGNLMDRNFVSFHGVMNANVTLMLSDVSPIRPKPETITITITVVAP